MATYTKTVKQYQHEDCASIVTLNTYAQEGWRVHTVLGRSPWSSEDSFDLNVLLERDINITIEEEERPL